MAEQASGVGSLRVGHRERDATVAVLREAAAAGRITLGELDQRISAALEAKTFAELDPVVADLTDRLPSQLVTGISAQPPTPSRTEPFRRPEEPGYRPDDPLRLSGGAGSEKRTGVWRVPPYLLISQGVGSVRLDCLQAVPAAEVIMIDLIGGAGSVVIVLPEGWAADLDRVSKGWGSTSTKVPHDPAPGQPLLVFRGSLGLGSLRVRPGRRSELRRLAR